MNCASNRCSTISVIGPFWLCTKKTMDFFNSVHCVLCVCSGPCVWISSDPTS